MKFDRLDHDDAMRACRAFKNNNPGYIKPPSVELGSADHRIDQALITCNEVCLSFTARMSVNVSRGKFLVARDFLRETRIDNTQEQQQ
jgi:hypothetical protein